MQKMTVVWRGQEAYYQRHVLRYYQRHTLRYYERHMLRYFLKAEGYCTVENIDCSRKRHYKQYQHNHIVYPEWISLYIYKVSLNVASLKLQSLLDSKMMLVLFFKLFGGFESSQHSCRIFIRILYYMPKFIYCWLLDFDI